MKCRVCGYEYDDSKILCPMCGTRSSETPVFNTDMEIKWNTRDFPKPRTQVEDVPLKWTNQDVSEGYVAVPENDQDQGSEIKQRLKEKSFTIRATNEEFQKLLDREYERLKAIQRGTADEPQEAEKEILFHGFDKEEQGPAAVEHVQSEEKPQEQYKREEIEVPGFFRREDQDKEEAASKEREAKALDQVLPQESNRSPEPSAPGDNIFDINVLDYSIKQMQEEEDKAQQDSYARRKKLDAMAAAREAYFKSLDESEEEPAPRTFGFWSRWTQPQRKAVEETPKTEIPVSELSKETEDNKKEEIKDDEGPLRLEDLTGPLVSSPIHTAKFDKEEFLAAEAERARQLELEYEKELKEEALRKAEEERLAEEARQAEILRQAEIARQRQEEIWRQQEEERKAEALRKAEEERLRKEAEQREEEERQKEALRQAEIERQQREEALRKAEEERRAEEERLLREEAERKAEEERQAEALRQAELERQQREEALRKAEEEKLAEEERKEERSRQLALARKLEIERLQKAEEDRKAELERQQREEAERQAEALRQAELERQQREEAERQAEALRQAELERQQREEAERQAEAQRQAELERQQREEAERQAEALRQAELERQQREEAERQAEALRQAELERQQREEAERKAEEERREAQQKNFAASLDKLFGEEEPSIKLPSIGYIDLGDDDEDEIIQNLSDIPEMKNTEAVQEPTMVPKPASTKKPEPEEDDEEDDYDDDDYDDYDDDEDGGERRGHWIIRFLITMLLVIVTIQLIVFVMGKLMPDSAITQTALAIARSVQEACDNFLANIIDKIVDLFHKGQ